MRKSWRRYGSKRRKLPFQSRSAVQRSARAGAVTRQVKQSMCKNLGTAFPGCLVTKFRMHGLYALQGSPSLTDGTAIATDKYYSRPLTIHPWQLAPSFANIVGLSSNAAVPPGFNRLWGDSGTGMYELGCVIKCSLIMKYHLHYERISNAPLQLPVGAPWVHFHHLRANGQDALPAPTTQALADTAYCQPDVRRKVIGTTNNLEAVSNGNQAANTTPSVSHFPTKQQFRWKRIIFPHVVVDQPFNQFVGTAGNFAVKDALPTSYALLDVAGFGNSANGATAVENRGLVELDAVFTVVLKDPYSNF